MKVSINSICHVLISYAFDDGILVIVQGVAQSYIRVRDQGLGNLARSLQQPDHRSSEEFAVEGSERACLKLARLRSLDSENLVLQMKLI